MNTLAPQPTPCTLSILVPAFNEQDNVGLLYTRLTKTLAEYGKTYEILFVEDGSTDRTFSILKELYAGDSNVRIIRFARNFGQQMAIMAGLRYARGHVVVLIDADMQSQPEEIPLLVDTLAQGYDIVYGVRRARRDPLWRKLGSRFVSYLLYRLTGINVPDSASGFIALDRQLVDRVNLYQEKTKFFSGLFAWLSYGRCAYVDVTHAPRHAGVSKYNLLKLIKGAFNFLCNFTDIPLQLSFFAALLLIGFSFLGWLGLFVSGLSGIEWAWNSILWLALLVVLIGGVQLAAMGVIGLYLGRIYREVREQPAFVVREVLEHESD